MMSVMMVLSMVACSSGSKSSSGGDSSGPAMKGSGNAEAATTTDSELLERYSLVELNSVANALRLTFEKKTDPKEGGSEPVLDCGINADQARKMMGPLKNLMDTQQEREREAYIMDPSVYARSHGLETCGAKCACSVLSNVLKPVSAKSFKLPAQRVAHDRFVKRLQAKASRQTNEEGLACARKVTWFCSSDLKGYLERQSGAL